MKSGFWVWAGEGREEVGKGKSFIPALKIFLLLSGRCGSNYMQRL